MAFNIRINGNIAMLVLSGDVDLQTTSDMKNDIVGIIGITQLDIDAGDVTYIDSSGIAVLLLARQHCLQNNITINFKSASSAIYRVLKMAKLDTILPIARVVDHAEDTGALGIGGEGVFSTSSAQDSSLSQDLDDDDPMMQALLQESGTSTDDNADASTGTSTDASTNNNAVSDDHPLTSIESGTPETANAPFGEAVSDEALASALFADLEDHEGDLNANNANAKPAANMSADQPDPAMEGDAAVVDTIKPGSFNLD